MNSIKWKIDAKGRAWASDEVLERLHLLEHFSRLEVHEGKLLWTDNERLILLAMLLENLGLDKVKEVFEKAHWDDWFDGVSASENFMASRDQPKDK